MSGPYNLRLIIRREDGSKENYSLYVNERDKIYPTALESGVPEVIATLSGNLEVKLNEEEDKVEFGRTRGGHLSPIHNEHLPLVKIMEGRVENCGTVTLQKMGQNYSIVDNQNVLRKYLRDLTIPKAGNPPNIPKIKKRIDNI